MVMLVVSALLALTLQLLPWGVARPVRAAGAPKAVIIVGPTNEVTASNLTDAEKMAQQAEAAGMDVRRVFFPHSTWDNVLANIQGASLVVYMGHGYGWPSPYTRDLTESRQNGMGLVDPDRPVHPDNYKYYGANKLRESVRLAPNAIVFLNHLCYAAGNGEPGMAIPSEDLARQRVDNMANGWLASGARAVYAYSQRQQLNYPQALMTTDKTVDELFMTAATGSSAGSIRGFVGWRNVRFASERTPGAVNHLDPHRNQGFYRAVTGDLGMTMAEWRSGASEDDDDPPPDVEGDAPQITSLTAGVDGNFSATSEPVGFHPNGDGLAEEVSLRHTVTRAAYLDATVTNSAGSTVKSYTVWSAQGEGGSRWNGKASNGSYVADGVYTLTYVPRDSAGAVGEPVSTQVLVLTAIALPAPSKPAFFAGDSDTLSKTTTIKVKVNQQAQVEWKLLDGTGGTVRTIRPASSTAAGTLKFTWDGKADDGSWVPDGWYRSVVTATTALGSYSQERLVYVGAFRVTPSISSPERGGKLTLTIVSTEALNGAPTVRFTQPGVDSWTATATRVTGKKYKLTVTIPASGGEGTLVMEMSARDKKGGQNAGSTSLTLR